TAPKLTPPAKPAAEDAAKDRGAMFDRRDVDKDGKLSKAEFMDKQKDPAHAAENFAKFDKDKSGDLTKEEFVKMGK
ncbi:EF-hand domain-containing protein, partial [bacterium]|nr:EF-hand domain-containing protein [bacterium]